VTAVEIHDKGASDTKLLPVLVEATAQNFRLKEVSADKGYGSVMNYKAIQRHGATPYIAFKSIHTDRSEGLWQRMYHFYQFNRAEFLLHYQTIANRSLLHRRQAA
jgi:Transposase DDE domain